jgi:hypothetical protein
MSIALSAVVIFILLLAPIAFYLAFTFGRFPRTGPRIGLLEGLMLSAIFSVVLHTVAISLVQREIRFDIIALLIGGDLKTFGTTVANGDFKAQLQDFVWYNSILIILAISTGRILRWLVCQFGWHTRSELVRLYNQWWYLFQGYKMDGLINGAPAPFDVVYIDALVNTNAGTMIYSGYLVDYVCKGEDLDRIYLSGTAKREFKITAMNEKGNYLVNKPSKPLLIEGDTMSIPYSSIINFNLNFVTFPAKFVNVSKDSKIDEPD